MSKSGCTTVCRLTGTHTRLRVLAPLGILLILAIIGPAAVPAAAQYAYKVFDEPNASQASLGTSATGVNDAGDVAGYYTDPNIAGHGFLFSGGNFTSFDFPGGADCGGVGTQPFSINNAGTIVGIYYTSNCYAHGFLRQVGGNFVPIDFPGSLNTYALGINNAGNVVGYYYDANIAPHGFLLKDGTYTTIDYPGVTGTGTSGTFPSGINDNGEVVGFYRTTTSSNLVFSMINGAFATTTIPGASSVVVVNGVNNAGDIVGIYQAADTTQHGFALIGGNLVPIDPPGSIYTVPGAINNAGQIAGWFITQASGSVHHSFVASPAILLDPVPDLLSGPAVVSGSLLQAFGGFGRPVRGVAADGVTQAVVRIPANSVGDQFTLTLVNDQNSQIIPDEDGALGNPGDTAFTQSQLTVTAIGVTAANGAQVPFAFAIYRAPVDFARPTGATTYKPGTCGGISKTDDQLACRSVSIQIQGPSGNPTALPITIVRPPVILIHGLWDNWTTWNDFSPLVSGSGTVDSRFSVGRVSYDTPLQGLITGSNPPYTPDLLQTARANSLGFQYNARNVLAQIEQWIGIENFKGGKNPANIPVAAVQADIVAHSMGGDITRTLVLQQTFLNGFTFGQGNIHKVITIDTPHLGSPLAARLLTTQESCVQTRILSPFGKFAFGTVTFSDGQTPTGAIGDLQPSSFALLSIGNQSLHPLPTALIAGTYTNFAAVQATLQANLIFLICGFNDPLAQTLGLNSAAWPAIFNNEANDAIVSESSQLNGLDASLGFVFNGLVHSQGVKKLGFSGPTVLDAAPASPIPSQVIKLLNIPVTQSVFNLVSP